MLLISMQDLHHYQLYLTIYHIRILMHNQLIQVLMLMQKYKIITNTNK
jgi:hypothetical protein